MEDRILDNQVPNNPVGVPDDQFTFQTIAELEVPPNLAEFQTSLDPQYEAMLQEQSDLINRFAMPASHNYNSPYPAPSTGGYNVNDQQTPPNLSTMQGKLRMFSDITKQAPKVKEDGIFGSNTIKIEDPIVAGIRTSNFDKFYASPAYSELGWHPHADMESYYNENTSWFDDSARMFGQLNKLMGTGYLSSYRSWFEDDAFDLKSAVEYEDAVRMGSSTKDGFGAGFNNFLLNSGYTFGIIGSIAVEELAMWGATALATVATAPAGGVGGVVVGAGAVARTATNAAKLAKLGRRIADSFSLGKMAAGTRAIMANLKNVERARNFRSAAKTGGNILGRMLIPETMSTFKNLKSAQKAGENLTWMARSSKKFGGFYRDARSMNFALSEGRMEGGSVYKDQLYTNYAIKAEENRKNGLGDITPEQMRDISQQAAEAGFATTSWNVPLIYLSNQLLLGNAFGGFKRSLSQIARDNIEGVGKRILKTKATLEGAKGAKKVARDVFEKVDDSFMNWKYLRAKVKAGGAKGGAVMAAGAGLRFFADNVAEGAQEIYQEAVSAGIKDYYTALFKDPANSNVQQMKASALSGLGEQWSSQGLETFMSGFFMGGVVSGPQKLVFQTMPMLYQKTFNKAEYAEYKKTKEDLVNATLSSLNNSWNAQQENVDAMFDTDTLNFMEQKEAGEAMERATMQDNVFDFVDAADGARFSALHRMFSTGKEDFFKEQLQDYLELTDQELAEAFPSEKAAAKSGKLRTKIQTQIQNIDVMKKQYDKNNEDMVNPYDPSAFTPNSKEHTEESYKKWAFNHAKMLFMFTKDGFTKAGERAQSIYNKLESDPILKELAANDITVLLNKDTLLKEIKQLEEEIPGLGEAGTKLLKKDKEKKLEKLKAIADVLYAGENQTSSIKNKRFDRRRTDKLMPKVLDYLKMLAKTKNSFVDESRIKEVVNMIVDHNHLSSRQRTYDKAIQFLANPKQLDLIVRRSAEYVKFAHTNKLDLQKELVEKLILRKEINELLNALMVLDVYVDPAEMLMFGKSGDSNVLQTFHTQDGILNEVDNPKLYNKVLSIIDVYRQSSGVQEKIDAEKAAEAAAAESSTPSATNTKSAIDELLQEEGIEAPNVKILGKEKNESPVLDSILESRWNQYRAVQTNSGVVPFDLEEFLETAIAKNIITAYTGLKKLWYQTLTNIENEEVRMLKYTTDTGFLNWLALQEVNDIVGKILDQSNLDFKFFIPDFKKQESENKNEKQDVEKLFEGFTGSNVEIIEIEGYSLKTQTNTKFYQIRQKNEDYVEESIADAVAPGNPTLSFSSAAKAIEIAKKIDPLVASLETYEFGGQTLQYGMRIKDITTGKYYIVLASPSELKSGRLYVLNEDYSYLLSGDKRTRNASAEKGKDGKTGLSEAEFQARFKVEKINLGAVALPKGASKLRVESATSLIPHKNDRGTRIEEGDELAFRRYAFIIQKLSKKELKSLEVTVTSNANGGAFIRQFKLNKEGAEENPFIDATTSMYNIAIKMPNALAARMNKLLVEENLNPAKDGIIGYIPNSDVILKDRKTGEVINPLNIQADQISDLFSTTKDSEVAAKEIQQSFAVQYTMMNALRKKLDGASEGTFSLADIGGVNFLTTPGYMDFLKKGETVRIDQLHHRTVEGNTVILKNTKRKGKVSTAFTPMGLSVDKEIAFQDKVKSEMKAQNLTLFDNASNAGRYVMIVKQENGVYSYFPIKSNTLEAEELNTLAETLIKQSALTVKENVKIDDDKKTKIDDLHYNSSWNQDLNNGELEGTPKFYIASIPGYSFDINITAKGGIQVKVYDRAGKEAISLIMSDVSAIAQYAGAENKSDLLKDLFNLVNTQLKEGPSKLQRDTTASRKQVVKDASKLSLNVDSLRKSFDQKTNAKDIAKDVVTTVSPSIRVGAKLITNIDGVDAQQMIAAGVNVGPSIPSSPSTTAGTFTETEIFTDAEGNPIPKGPELTTSSSDPNSVDLALITNEEFNELLDKDFIGLTNNQKDFIAEKRASGIKLSNREERVMDTASVSGQINIMIAKKLASKSSTASDPKKSTSEKTEVQLRAELEKIKSEIEAKETELFDNAGTRAEYAELINEDSSTYDGGLKALRKKRTDILSKLAANKVISDDLTMEDVANIDEFMQWAAENLPDFITIENIDTLGNNMKSGGQRVGAFVMALNKIAGKETIKGTIYAGTSTRHAYHEAFHAIFELLLTEEQQNQYYKIAKKELLGKLKLENKTLQSALEELKNSDRDKYKNYSKEKLEKLLYEEYMADEFENFKQNPKNTKTSSWIKSLFNKMLEWIRNVLGTYNATELQLLFEEVNAGKFRSGKVQINPFTDAAASGVTLDASKIIRSKSVKGADGFEYDVNLDPDVGRGMVSSIAARVIMLEMENEDPNFNIADAVQESIELYRDLYNPSNPQYETLSKAQYDLLIAIDNSFQDFGRDFYEAVVKELDLYDMKLELKEDEDGVWEEAYGLRTTSEYDKDASSTGGFRSLSAFIRKYIGTTTVSEKDIFGQTVLRTYEKEVDGKKITVNENIITAVDFGVAYSGFLKAASGKSDPVAILQSLYLFSIDNPQTSAVVQRLFNDLGIVWEGQLENGELPGTTLRNDLFQAMLKGFENFKVDYLFIHRITGTGKDDVNAGKVITYDAANRDDAHEQIARWSDNFKMLRKRFNLDPNISKDLSKELSKMLMYLDSENQQESLTDKKLGDVSRKFAKLLENTLGIALSPRYIAFSIASNLVKLTSYQSSLVNSQKDVVPLQYKAIEELRIGVDNNADIMSETDEGLYGRLRTIALGNAPFDERIGASIFRNPNGDLVYAHQLPTFHLKKIASLNDVKGKGAVIADLAETDPFLAMNFLVNSEAMQQLSAEGRLKISRLSGSKSSKAIEKDESGGITETYDKNEKGTVYGDYNPQEFITALLSSYISNVNPKSGKVNDVIIESKDGEKSVALAPALIRVIEASNTGDMINLPIIKAVLKSASGKPKITQEAIDAFGKNIESEFNRIMLELNPETGSYNPITGEGELIVGANADKTGQVFDINGRAFRFTNNRLLLQDATKRVSTDIATARVEHNPELAGRIEDGTQTMYIMSDAGAKFSNFRTSDQIRNVSIQGRIGAVKANKKKGVKAQAKKLIGDPILKRVKSYGKISVDGLNESQVIEKFGAALHIDKIPNAKKDHIVIIADRRYYVESLEIKEFLQGKRESYLYEVLEDVDTSEDTGLDQQLADAVANEDYETAAKIRNEIDDLSQDSFAVRLEKLLKDNAKLPAGEQIQYTLDSALKAIGESKKTLDKFIEKRLDERSQEFETYINKLLPEGSLPKFLTEGLVGSTTAGKTANFVRANEKLNLTNNFAYNLKQIFLNDLINTTAINDILLGDQAYTLKDAVDAVKRAKMQNAAYYSAESKIAAPEMGVKKATSKISLFATTDPIGTSIHTGKDIEIADAQNYMTVKAFRYTWFGFGKLTMTQSKLIDKIEKGEDILVDEIFGAAGAAKKQEMLNSKKFVYGDGRTFDKMSIVPLTKALTSYKNEQGQWVARPDRVRLHNIRVKMEQFEQANDTIAITAPLSALKMLKKNVTLIDDFSSDTAPIWQTDSKLLGPGSALDYMERSLSTNASELSVDQSMELDASFMGLQVLNPSNKMEIVDPTQIKSLITGEQSDNTEVILNGKVVSVKQLRDQYNKATSDRMLGKHLDKRNLTFSFDAEYASDQLHKSIKEGAITVDLFNYLEYARTSLESSQSASELIEFFTTNEETGEQKYELNNPIVIAKFEQLFLSYFSKGVTSEKLPGTSAALMSDFGMNVYRRVISVDEKGHPLQQEIIRSDDFLKNYSQEDLIARGDNPLDFSDDKSFETLKLEVEKAKGKGVIILDRLRSDMTEFKDGKPTKIKYSESLLPAHSKEAYTLVDQVPSRNIPDALSRMFGIRIPSQDNHSTVNIKVVDFLPVFYGSTIVSSRELVEVSGADFDIDKLYIQMKDHYEDNGEFKEYSDSHEDYVRYVNKQVTKPGTIYNEALLKSEKGMDESVDNKTMDAFKKEKLTTASINALTELKLPRSKKEYALYIEKNDRVPYAAALNNEILDLKMALMGHEGVTKSIDGNAPISYEAADIEILTDVWKEISEEIPELAELVNEDGIDANDLFGKSAAFTNNKAGARSIGAAVLPNLYLSLMQEYGLEVNSITVDGKTEGVKLEFDNKVFRNFRNKDENGKSTTRELLEDGTEGRRKQYIISALITAMTDNAKERLAAKLGLSRDSLAVVTNMTAMGVPIKTSILLMNQPQVKRIYELKALSGDPTFSVGFHMGQMIEALEDAVKNFNVNVNAEEINVNEETLIKAIKNPIETFDDGEELALKLKTALNNKQDVNAENMVRDIAILNQFINAHKIAKYTRNIGVILNLTNGYGKNLSEFTQVDNAIKELGLNLSDAEYDKLSFNKKPIIDVRKIFRSKTWQTTLLNVYLEFSESLTPKVFLSQSRIYKSMYNAIIGQMIGRIDNETKDAIRRDILSYITLKAWTKLSIESSSSGWASLNNDIIYEEGESSIANVIEKARESNGNTYNAFLDDFIKIERASGENNKIGITTISANTLTPLNDSQKINVQNGFKELFINPETRNYAIQILNYLMVKDGLQPTYKTLLAAVSPSMLGRYLDSITTVREAVAREEDSSQLFESIFGMTVSELREDFISNYLVSTKNKRFVQPKGNGRNAIQSYNPKSQITTSTSNFTTDRVIANPSTLFVIFDNESGVGAPNSGIVRDQPNVFRIKFKKDITNSENSFYTEEQVNDKIKDLDAQINDLETLIESFPNGVIFPAKLEDNSRKALRENNENIHDHLATLLQEKFNYRINGVKTKEQAEEVAVNEKAVKKPIYINNSKEVPVLIIDLNKNIGKQFAPKSNNIQERIQPKLKNSKERDTFKSNLNTLYDAGFKKVTVVRNNVQYDEVLLPTVIKIKGQLFQLVTIAGSQLGSEFILDTISTPTGSYAEYIAVPEMGSTGATAIGFVFPNLKTTNEVREIIKEANPEVAGESGGFNAGGTTLQQDYNQGTFPALDSILEQKYEAMLATAKKYNVQSIPTYEKFILTDTAQKIIENYVDVVSNPDSEVSYTDGSITVNGNPLNDLKAEIEEAGKDEAEDSFVIGGIENNTLDDSTNADEIDIFGTSSEDTLTDWYDNLKIIDQQKLSAAGIKSVKDLIKESKKNSYVGTTEEFIEEIKQCFLS